MLNTFQDNVLLTAGYKGLVIEALLGYVDQFRKGLNENDEMYHTLGKMLVALYGSEPESIYHQFFQRRYLDNALNYYAPYSAVLSEYDIYKFLQSVVTVYDVEHFLNDMVIPETRKYLEKKLFGILLIKPFNAVFDVFKNIYFREKKVDLKN